MATTGKFAEEVTGRVYVWEIPVRLTHWVNVFSIIVLSFTGYYIGNPYVRVSPREAYGVYFMGLMRFVHFAFAFIFVGSLAVRTYWGFIGGNRYASWRALIPFFTPEGRGKLKHALQYYTFMRRDPPTVLGHNALAGFTYAWIVLLYFLQVLTGFALYGQVNPGGFWWKLTGWLFLLISNQNVRLVHHLIMWLLIAFAIHHVYSAFLVDVEEANGLMSSIFSGWKFIVPEPKEEIKAKSPATRADWEKVQ
ncbi:MAG: Ni/Fe-hydrogenase, b-type cytochrome subunit [Caldilineae bacterium]|nr:MAG: Ni/Fe-hydrogenase, b-type cytochrome subunit [Caldilineae bacterium]